MPKPEKKITLEQFKEVLIQDADKFVKNWEEQMAKLPDIFDAEMTVSEWWSNHFDWSSVDDDSPESGD